MASATDDLLFKLVFGSKNGKNILIHLLNSIVSDNIRDIEVRPTELFPEYIGGKAIRLDILAKDREGRLYNIELQKCNGGNMIDRSLFYWSEIYFQQLSAGQDYHTLKKTICINILEYKLFNDDEEYWHVYHMREDKTQKILTDKEEIHFIEIPKMREYSRDRPLTYWIEFLKDPYSDIIRKVSEYEPVVKEAVDMFGRVLADPETKELIRVRNKWERDFSNAVSSAVYDGELKGIKKGELIGIQKGREEGREEGIVLGREEGREEGELIGMQKGREEGRKETAINLLQMGLTIEQVSKATGLSIEDIEGIERSIPVYN
jgi:predicted transposase/invertase (TIGR01784 family)